VEAVQEGISTTCASAAHSILFFLKNSGSIKSETNFESLEALSAGLRSIFGYGSKVIEKEILKVLYTKLHQPLADIPRDFDFAEQVERAFKLHRTNYKVLALQNGGRRPQ
jgi:hypothetical protein